MTEPKEILGKARRIQQQIDRRQAELIRLREMESYLTATDPSDVVVKHSGGRGPVERQAVSAADKLARVERLIQRDIDQLAQAKLEAIALIGLLGDTRMQEVLWEYYIRCSRNWDEAAEKLYMGRRTAMRLHGHALEKLRLALNGTANVS